MNNVSLWHQYDYQIIGDDVRVFLKNSENMQKEITDLKKQLEKKRKASERVDALRKEMGDEAFYELLVGILSDS